MEDLQIYFFLRLWVNSYQRNYQRGIPRVHGNVSNGSFFWKNHTFVVFFRIKATFRRTTEDKPWEGCQKCILGVREKFTRKTEVLVISFFYNSFRTLSERASADFKTTFVVSTEICRGKGGSPQRVVRFIPSLDSENRKNSAG